MIAIGSDFFYTVTLPCTLWFFDKGKKKKKRKDEVLFIDARNIYDQIDRANAAMRIGRSRKVAEKYLEYWVFTG
jgi:type I restriction-modification system DNA methylase subunit